MAKKWSKRSLFEAKGRHDSTYDLSECVPEKYTVTGM